MFLVIIEEKNACCMEADQTEVSSSGQPGTTLVSIDMNAEKGVIIRRVLRNIIHGKRKGKAELIETTKTGTYLHISITFMLLITIANYSG